MECRRGGLNDFGRFFQWVGSEETAWELGKPVSREI